MLLLTVGSKRFLDFARGLTCFGRLLECVRALMDAFRRGSGPPRKYLRGSGEGHMPCLRVQHRTLPKRSLAWPGVDLCAGSAPSCALEEMEGTRHPPPARVCMHPHSELCCTLAGEVPAIKAILVVDADGKRILSRYYSADWATAADETSFEKKLYDKTMRTNAKNEGGLTSALPTPATTSPAWAAHALQRAHVPRARPPPAAQLRSSCSTTS